jgi:hypothetical protein
MDENDNAIVSRKIILFKEFDQAFPEIKLPNEV